MLSDICDNILVVVIVNGNVIAATRLLNQAISESLRLLPSQGREECDVLVSSMKFCCQEFNLELQVFYLLSFGVVIPDRGVRDLSCLARVLKCAQIFFKIFVTWMQTGDHTTEGVSSKRLSE